MSLQMLFQYMNFPYKITSVRKVIYLNISLSNQLFLFFRRESIIYTTLNLLIISYSVK